MPTTSNGIIRVKLFQTYSQQQVLNIWHYHVTNDSNPAVLDNFAGAFDALWMADLASIQSNLLTYDSIEVENITTLDAPFVLTPSQGDGDVVGSELPSYVAAGFRLIRQTKETRNGAKRFCGMVEENLLFNQWENAFIAALGSVALNFDNTLNDGVLTYEPVIVRGGNYPNTTVWTYNRIVSAQVNTFATTQNSRKRRA